MATALFLSGCFITPQPLDDADREAEAFYDVKAIYANQEPLNGPLTLPEAFARALAYNLDHHVKLMEAAVAQNDLDISEFDMLPRLVGSAGYSWRDNVDASSSRSVLTNTQSLEPSTSTDRNRGVADLTLSWNILDFGVSYYTARQNANRTLIAEEQRRRVTHSLLQDVRRAFWRAASAQRLQGEVRAATASARAALASSRRIESEGLRSPVDALRYQKALLDLLRQLEAAQTELTAAKSELAALINLPLGVPYTIKVPAHGGMRLARPTLPIDQMEHLALLRNPDLREASYQARISADESRKILLRLLPGIDLSYGPNWDSNSFLVNNTWQSAAARVSGSVISLLQLPTQFKRAENAELLAERRRQALSIAVLAKVHVAYQQYLAAMREHQWAAELASVDRRLYRQIANQVTTDAQGDLERVSVRVSAVTSELLRYQMYAEAQAALGRLYANLGIDPVSEEEAAVLDLDGLRRAIERAAAERPYGLSSTAANAAKPANAATPATQVAAKPGKPAATSTPATATASARLPKPRPAAPTAQAEQPSGTPAQAAAEQPAAPVRVAVAAPEAAAPVSTAAAGR